ncbi:MAG: HlyC/CorC family transporter [Burkholderiales bacterium]|nr:HlyC/CorC family transporter [Burkholderiales bacterium]
MEHISPGTIAIALVVLLVVSGFFSIAETSMMALNRYRLKHLVETGRRGARLTQGLLGHTDRLLGVILLGNNLVNAAAATLTAIVTVQLFGENKIALAAGTAAITFLILVFSEITPKVIGATYPERIAFPAAFVLAPLLKIAYPFVWFTNLFVRGLLRVSGLRQRGEQDEPHLSLGELRTLVLESSHYIPKKHQSMLLNLFELESVTVDDVMTPRNQIEAIDLDADFEDAQRRIATCYHTRLPVYRGQLDEIAGVLHVRSVLNLGTKLDLLGPEDLHAVLREPYFIPAGTPLLTQLQNFQENHDRLGLVVDEYGELMGLVTIDDILEEIIGEFTTNAPFASGTIHRQADGSALVEGSLPLRELNRKLDTTLPLDGPKTLNGLILEHLQDIPEPGTTVLIDGYPLEIVQTQEKVVKAVRIYPRRKENGGLNNDTKA